MKRIVAIMLVLMLTFGCAALAETELKVAGKGTVYMEADRVSASLGINLTGEDLTELQQEANNTVAAVIAALKEAGMEDNDISTNYIYIAPRYDYSGDVERMVGYSINNSMTITTDDIDNIGAYIDAAFGAGANTFDSISFSVADDSDARKQALELAVQDAQSKAETISAAAGMTLGPIEDIYEGSENDYYSNSTAGSGAMYAMDAAVAEGAGTTVRAARINVTASVQITYQLQ